MLILPFEAFTGWSYDFCNSDVQSQNRVPIRLAGSFPKGYKLPVPPQFQQIYYLCRFDIRLAVSCCDTGNQSKTLVGTTGQASRRRNKQKARFTACSEDELVASERKRQGNRKQRAKVDRNRVAGVEVVAEGYARLLLVGCSVCWRFIRPSRVFHTRPRICEHNDVHLACTRCSPVEKRPLDSPPQAIKVIIAGC